MFFFVCCSKGNIKGGIEFQIEQILTHKIPKVFDTFDSRTTQTKILLIT